MRRFVRDSGCKSPVGEERRTTQGGLFHCRREKRRTEERATMIGSAQNGQLARTASGCEIPSRFARWAQYQFQMTRTPGVLSGVTEEARHTIAKTIPGRKSSSGRTRRGVLFRQLDGCQAMFDLVFGTQRNCS